MKLPKWFRRLILREAPVASYYQVTAYYEGQPKTYSFHINSINDASALYEQLLDDKRFFDIRFYLCEDGQPPEEIGYA